MASTDFPETLIFMLPVYVRYPKPTYFQCVYHKYLLDFILCCNDRQFSYQNQSKSGLVMQLNGIANGRYEISSLLGNWMKSGFISCKENISFCLQWSTWGM